MIALIYYSNPTPAGFTGNYRWRQYIPSTSDYLYIGSNMTEMRLHLRQDKVAFWNELILQKMQPESMPVKSIKTYWREMWVFVATSIALLFLLVLALIRLVRKKPFPSLSYGTRHNFASSPVNV